jgi:hypothetical protein
MTTPFCNLVISYAAGATLQQKLSTVAPHCVHDHGKTAGQGKDRLLSAAAAAAPT